jgi:fatty acid CoA ligase FadD9
VICQLGHCATRLACALRSLVPRGAFVAFCGANRNETAITDFACALAGLVSVGVHSTFDAAGASSVLNNAEARVVVVDHDRLPLMVATLADGRCPSVTHVVLMDDGLPAGVTLHNVRVHRMSDMVWDTTTYPAFELEPYDTQASDPIFTLLYTSGSTGQPKGVVISPTCWRTDVGQSIPATIRPLVGVSYIPLSHSSDRIRVWQFLGHGGRVGFAHYAHTHWVDHETVKKAGLLTTAVEGDHDVDSFLADVSQLSPIAFAGPPRIWSGLYHIYQKRAKELAEADGSLSAANDERLRAEITGRFGRRLQKVATGGAPTSAAVKAWVADLFPLCSFAESYGATECGGITMDGQTFSQSESPVPYVPPNWQQLGMAIPSFHHAVQVRLADVPDKGFTNADLPHPRGEIQVKSLTMASGYYRQPDATAAAFTADGFFRTGDLGLCQPDGTLVILERTSAVASLRGGRVVCPSALETHFEGAGGCASVAHVFVHADARCDRVVAVVRPSPAVLAAEGGDLAAVRRRILVEVAARGAALQLAPAEVPAAVVVTELEWTADNGLLNVHLHLEFVLRSIRHLKFHLRVVFYGVSIFSRTQTITCTRT